MLEALKRHPFAVQAHFRWSLVLAYGVPADQLRTFVPPGLELDTFGDLGMVAIALVQTEGLRPKGLPKIFGRDFFLSGYRVFVRFVRPSGTLRGLRILRSDTDRRTMVAFGNTFTHYNYHLAVVTAARQGERLTIDLRTHEREANLHIDADLSEGAGLPEGSPFATMEEARHFAGPMPYTFDVDAPTGKILSVRGLRKAWSPRPVRILAQSSSWLERPELAGARLANAFYVEDIPYAWKPGVLEEVT
jgi:uncharacterized protein YqjF (DUF2071 family)